MSFTNRFKASVAVAVAVAAVAAAGRLSAQENQMPAGVQVQKSSAGTMVLANAKGMTLYTFAKDMKDMSHCSGPCAQNWPPLAAPADAKPVGSWTIVTRDDKTRQWSYKGQPLYTWIKDTKPGETSGDGVGMGAWKVAVP
jgi:predicted lipoprotein with Yx(FWY)xxD motif